MLLQIFSICFILIAVYLFSSYQQKSVAESYRNISFNQFPKVASISKLIASFRQVRIKVRTLGLTGNSQQVQSKYIKETKEAITKFVEEKKKFEAMSFTKSEMKSVEELDKQWKSFLLFGTELLSKYQNPTPESLKEGSHMIRDICPIKAKKWISIAENFLIHQDKVTLEVVNQAAAKETSVMRLGYISIFLCAITSLFIGFVFSRNIVNSIQEVAMKLKENAQQVDISSEKISTSSTQLSQSSIHAASSLQQTVSSIDEISSMIQRNADAANSSTKVSSLSSEAANRGRETINAMISSINDISTSNDQIVKEMEQNNKDFSRVVEVISEIGDKTEIINDIVFQTKLLSFNASVEAARAGEHGKGFAVVAEEVGNLATMSGKAASEISDMLEASIRQVSEIVENTKKKVETITLTNQEKVQNGTNTANQCGHALDEILENVNSVNEMVSEIATASNEQSTGVQEITKAMQELDQTTHQNNSVAQESSSMSTELKTQANGLNFVVEELITIISGEDKKAS